MFTHNPTLHKTIQAMLSIYCCRIPNIKQTKPSYDLLLAEGSFIQAMANRICDTKEQADMVECLRIYLDRKAWLMPLDDEYYLKAHNCILTEFPELLKWETCRECGCFSQNNRGHLMSCSVGKKMWG